MLERFKIAAYTRISVDLELDKDNTSIENQKAIIGDYCKLHFPTSDVDYYEDRDHSGYTFEQRPDYYLKLRPKLLRGEYDILIVKDLSRFSRRTGKGLADFEDLADTLSTPRKFLRRNVKPLTQGAKKYSQTARFSRRTSLSLPHSP